MQIWSRTNEKPIVNCRVKNMISAQKLLIVLPISSYYRRKQCWGPYSAPGESGPISSSKISQDISTSLFWEHRACGFSTKTPSGCLFESDKSNWASIYILTHPIPHCDTAVLNRSSFYFRAVAQFPDMTFDTSLRRPSQCSEILGAGSFYFTKRSEDLSDYSCTADALFPKIVRHLSSNQYYKKRHHEWYSGCNGCLLRRNHSP